MFLWIIDAVAEGIVHRRGTRKREEEEDEEEETGLPTCVFLRIIDAVAEGIVHVTAFAVGEEKGDEFGAGHPREGNVEGKQSRHQHHRHHLDDRPFAWTEK